MRLSELQSRVLETLAGIEPAWTLTGGAALSGFHLGHRPTRDLDLFWHGRRSLGDLRREVTSRLQAAGFDVTELRTMDSFSALRVTQGQDSVVVDLVAEPVPSIEPPERVAFRGVTILVDTPHEVLVNKLCALLHRSEPRDLLDIEGLLGSGADLDRAIADAPKKDGGFSALTLGWTLKDWPVAQAARAAGLVSQAADLERFRDELMERVTGERP